MWYTIQNKWYYMGYNLRFGRARAAENRSGGSSDSAGKKK